MVSLSLKTATVLFFFIILTQQGVSQELTLTPSSSTACPGDLVSLVCHHPEVANNAQRYLITTPAWRESGSAIRVAPGTRYQATTATDFINTTLSFAISSEQFNESSYYYDCLLVLATREDETSGNATVEVSELSSPVLTSTTSLESSITVEWLAANCARSYSVSWECTGPSSTGGISTTNTNIMIPVESNSECTLRVVAIDAEGFAGPNTAAVAVYPGFPRPANASSSTLSCTNRSLLLTCQFGGGEYIDIQWTSSRGPVDSSGGSLTINDATILQRGTKFWCSGVPVGGTATFRVTGESYVYSENLTCEPTIASPSLGGDSAAAGAAVIAGGSIGGVLVVVIVFIAGCVSGVLAHVLYRKVTAKKSAAPPSSPPAPSYGHTQGDVGAGPDMTDNPSYQLVERSQDSKQLYQNL